MAQITITIPDAQVDRVRTAFSPFIRKPVADITAQDVSNYLAQYIKDIVRSYEEDMAYIAARDSITDVDAT